MKIIKSKNIGGLTLIESLIAVIISISTLVFILAFIGRNVSENEKRSEVSDDLTILMKAIINRIDVDAGVKNISDTTYNDKAGLQNFVKLMNGKNSSCGSWNPESVNSDLNSEMIGKQSLKCNYFDSKMFKSKATAKIDKNDGSISVIFDYSDGGMKDNIMNWSSVISDLIINPEIVGYGAQSYGFINKVKGESIKNSECAADFSNCAVKVSYRLANESDTQYLSTVGANMQVGKIKFTNGMLNPQVCKNWVIQDDGLIKEQEDVFCGIENNDGKLAFKLNDIQTDSVTVGGECRMMETDLDYNFVGYESGTFPCGLIKIRRDSETSRQLIVGSITDATSIRDARTRMTTTERNDARISTQEVLSVGDSMKTFDAKTISLKVESGFRALEIKAARFGTNHSFIYDLMIGKDENEYRNIKSPKANIFGVNRTNELQTNRLHTQDITANGIVFDGDLKIDGDIKAKSYSGVGTLNADKIVDDGNPFNLRASAFLGSYIESVDGQNKDKIGLTGADGIDTTGSYIQALEESGTGSRLKVKSGNIETVDINQSSQAQWIKKGVTVRGSLGDYYKIDENGNLSIKTNQSTELRFTDSTNLTANNSLMGRMPSQVLGDMIVTERTPHSIIVNERFDDVFDDSKYKDSGQIDLSVLENSHQLDPYPDYAKNSLLNAVVRHSALTTAYWLVDSRVNTAENATTSRGAKGATGEKGERGFKGEKGPQGKTGAEGAAGAEGGIYNPNGLIWLAVNQMSPASYLTPKEAEAFGESWTYSDVIEGECEVEGQYKHFQDTTSKYPFSNKYRTEVYQCQRAIKRLEPYGFNRMPVYSVCDITEENPNLPTVDKDGNEIIYGEFDNDADPSIQPENETDFNKLKRLKKLFEGKSLGARQSDWYADCRVDGDYFYTEEVKSSDEPQESVRISISEFEKLIRREPVVPSSTQYCKSKQVYQISRCQSSGYDPAKYQTHPTGFLKSIGREY